MLRLAVARSLEPEGYTVQQATSAYPGQQLLAKHADASSVVLSTLRREAARRARPRPATAPWPPLADVVLMTAYGTIADGGRARREGAFDYLAKGNADEPRHQPALKRPAALASKMLAPSLASTRPRRRPVNFSNLKYS